MKDTSGSWRVQHDVGFNPSSLDCTYERVIPLYRELKVFPVSILLLWTVLMKAVVEACG